MALIALAGSTGLEPATSDVTGRRSNQTELTPQADVRVCFRSRALRGLVYTEVCPARNNFFEKIFWVPPCRHIVQSVLRACAAARLARMLLNGVGLMDLVELPPLAQMETGDASASPVFVAVSLGQ